MAKLDLQTQSLLNKVSNGAASEDKEKEIKVAMKSFACDLLNMVEGLRAMKVDNLVIKNMVEEYGIQYNGKSKKFL